MKYTACLLPLLILLSCQVTKGPEKWLTKKAPEYFQAEFTTTKGVFVIESYRSWSPEGVDRLYQLIGSGYYTDIAIFRVVTGFVAQFGISNDSTLNDFWEKYTLNDEPVIEKNIPGNISFARAGAKTRTTQLFINLGENSPRLDELEAGGVRGYPVVARIIQGMDNVSKLNAEYGEKPSRQQGIIKEKGNAFLKETYPNLDYILTAKLIKAKPRN